VEVKKTWIYTSTAPYTILALTTGMYLYLSDFHCGVLERFPAFRHSFTWGGGDLGFSFGVSTEYSIYFFGIRHWESQAHNYSGEFNSDFSCT
jgi:hypothetical protein